MPVLLQPAVLERTESLRLHHTLVQHKDGVKVSPDSEASDDSTCGVRTGNQIQPPLHT